MEWHVRRVGPNWRNVPPEVVGGGSAGSSVDVPAFLRGAIRTGVTIGEIRRTALGKRFVGELELACAVASKPTLEPRMLGE